MLLKDFYTVENIANPEENRYLATVLLNPKHEIFKGHFPGNPVTPGVCMMQIIKELTEKIVQHKLFLQNAVNVKFMALINPETTPRLQLQLEISKEGENLVKVKNTTTFDETVALKLSNTYQILEA
ncbi:MAG TPA: hypothetical protein VKZ42_06935 [Flavobacteriaceae bacterium]|nr:hypothetical protein [Flavobacteriaceae bacterium]